MSRRNGRRNLPTAATTTTTENDNNNFSDTVSRILLRVDRSTNGGTGNSSSQAAVSSSKKHQQGPLRPEELSELTFLCTTAAAAAATSSPSSQQQNGGSKNNTAAVGGEGVGFGTVEGDDLIGLIELLDRHVNLAVSVHLVEAAIQVYQQAAESSSSPSQAASLMEQWLKHGEGRDKIAALRGGLEAAAIILFIATSDVDRRAINEDAIEVSITLMRMHLFKHLVPALNQTGHFLAPSKDGKANIDTQPASPSKQKRRRTASGTSSSIPAKDLKRVYKHIVESVNLQLVLMERLEYLVQTLPLDNQQVLLLTSGALPALEIDCNCTAQVSPPGQQLQLASIAVIAAAFRRYPNDRDTIMEDVFPAILRLPTGKRSMRAFPIRYTSAAAPAGLEEWNTDIVGPLLSCGARPHYIQMMTALVLHMVQASVCRPTHEVAKEQEGEEEENETNQQTLGVLQSGLRHCHAVADAFVAHLLKLCTRNKSGSASEYRPFLANVIEDLLLVLLVPEYPGAEILLTAFRRRLNEDMTKACSSKDHKSDTTFLNSAFDAMGKICAAQARILRAARDKPISITTDIPMSDTSDKDVDCHCQSKNKDVLMIQCDHCNTIFHASCVGVPNNESTPEEWFCDPCCLGKILGREKPKLKESEAEYLDQYYAMQHSFQAVTAHRLGVDMSDAVHIHLARWVDKLEFKRLNDDNVQANPRRIINQLLEHWDEPGPGAEPLTEEGSLRVTVTLLAKTSPLFVSFKQQIRALLGIMGDESMHSLRKLSLKAIEKTVQGDEDLMLLPVITNAVSLRLGDESISVREAAVSLVGSYVVKCPQAIQSYQHALLPCLTDVGVSVRKRAVKIFQAILLSPGKFQGRSSVCNIMLQRSADPKEEDGVRDLIDELFCALWLRNGDEELPKGSGSRFEASLAAAAQVASVPGVVTPSSPACQARRKSPPRRSDAAAEQMMEVVRVGGTGNHLESLLKKLLTAGQIDSDNGRKKAERKKRQELGQKQCTQLVNSLFELLMVVEEQRDIRPQVGKDIAATLTTIAVFACVTPYPIMKHLDTMLPYLKADNGVSAEDESAIVQAACDVLVRLAPAFEKQHVRLLASSSLGKDLTKISYRFGPAVLGSAVRAFSALAHHPEAGNVKSFAEMLLQLAKVFYGYLVKNNHVADFSNGTVTNKTKDGIHRALTVLGCICENHEMPVDSWGSELEEGENVPLLSQEELTWENITLQCYRLFNSYLQKHDPDTKCRALAALKGIFVAQPQLLLQLDHVGLFDEVMSDDAGVPVQLEALECWRTILEAEESRVESGQAAAKMDADGNITLSKRISGDQNGDATLFGGVLTGHSERLYEMIHSPVAVIRHSTLELLGLLLRQGLVNPNEAVPHLFALQGDTENEPIRTLALQLLMTEGERRPDTLRRRFCAGVQQAYKFQRSIYPNVKSVSAVIGGTTLFDRVFQECIAKNQKLRQGLYKSLLTLFEVDHVVDGKSLRMGEAKDLSLLSFAAQILARLPYNCASDPLFIVHHISSIITLQGLQTVDLLSNFLRPYGLSNADELDETNTEADALERAAQSKFPSRTQEAKQLSSKNFDLEKFMALCRDGASLVLLLRLKTFLCTSYNLSANRCIEYDPNVKICDKGIVKPSFSEPFNASVAAVLQLQSTNKAIDKDALLKSYAEFRQMIREDENAFARMSEAESDAEGEKLTPAKRSGSESEDSI